MPRKFSEEVTRKEMIDPQLEQAGWYLHDHSKIDVSLIVDQIADNEKESYTLVRLLDSPKLMTGEISEG